MIVMDECPICFEEMESMNHVYIPICGHKYHERCVLEWFDKKGDWICPECNEPTPYVHIKGVQSGIIYHPKHPPTPPRRRRICPDTMVESTRCNPCTIQ